MENENKFAIMHIAKHKTKTGLTKSYNHNYRRLVESATPIGGDYTSFRNVDLSRVHFDQELIPTYKGQDYTAAFDVKIANMDYYKTNKLRKDAVICLEVMLTMSPDIVGKVNVDEWAKANVEWLKKEFGDSLESAMLHLDETTPHIHAMGYPIVNGRFCCKEFLGDVVMMRTRQDTYAAAMEPFGLERGIKGMKAKHQNLKHLHGDIEAAVDNAKESLEVRRSGLFDKMESAESYHERISPIVTDLTVKLKALGLENARLRKVQDLVIKKDKEYAQIQSNINDNLEIKNMAAKWKVVETTMNEHPAEKVRTSFKAYIDMAEQWYEKQGYLEFTKDIIDKNNK